MRKDRLVHAALKGKFDYTRPQNLKFSFFEFSRENQKVIHIQWPQLYNPFIFLWIKFTFLSWQVSLPLLYLSQILDMVKQLYE